MEFVRPSVHLIAETGIIRTGIQNYLDEIGATDWNTDAPSDSEELAEVMGRVCYKAFAPGLNPNVTKIREGNNTYLKNIINSQHGSVLEHGSISLIFHNVSRVFTHELSRHRVGIAISQESLRYVRLTELKGYFPQVFDKHPKAKKILEIFKEVFRKLEQTQEELTDILDLDSLKMEEKKLLTSAMRRVAPIGLATTFGWTTNFRNLRHVIKMRTSRFAEEEIRLVFGEVAEIVSARYPNFFADFKREMVNGFYEWTTKSGNEKI